MAFTAKIADLIAEDKTGLLGKHPSWERVFLSEIAAILNGAPFDSAEFSSIDGIPLTRIRDVTAGETSTYYTGDYDDTYLLDKGDLLIGMDGDFNTGYWGSQRALLNQRVCKLTPNGDFYDKKLLGYALPGYLAAINANTPSITVKHLSSKTVGEIELPLPPRSEQTRIVEKLEELLSDLDAGVAELKAAQRKLAQYRQSLLKAAVEGTLTADWRATQGPPRETGAELLQRILIERRARWEQKQLAKFAEQGKAPPKDWQAKYPEPAAPDLTNLPPLPTGWVWASVEQLSIAQKYGSSAKTNEDSSGIPVLRMGNIQDGDIDCASLKYLPIDHPEFPELFLEDGDLLFNRTNSPELVGKTAIYRSQVSPCSYASYLIAVKLLAGCVPELVAAYINSAHGRRWIKSVATQQVGQANVNGTKLAALTVPLAPFVEQIEIAAVLSYLRHEAVRQGESILRGLMQASAQRKNILKAAFAGQLVPQDPSDEPASELLARIRAAREQSPATRGRRRAGSNPAPATMSPSRGKRGRKAKEGA